MESKRTLPEEFDTLLVVTKEGVELVVTVFSIEPPIIETVVIESDSDRYKERDTYIIKDSDVIEIL